MAPGSDDESPSELFRRRVDQFLAGLQARRPISELDEMMAELLVMAESGDLPRYEILKGRVRIEVTANREPDERMTALTDLIQALRERERYA